MHIFISNEEEKNILYIRSLFARSLAFRATFSIYTYIVAMEWKFFLKQ